MRIRAYNIQWDADGEDSRLLGLPDDYIFDTEADEDDDLDSLIGDRLSDDFGYCHFGFEYEILEGGMSND